METLKQYRTERSNTPRKLTWFVLLWLGGVLTVGVVSLLLRAVLLP